jgi:hypothetical protein
LLPPLPSIPAVSNPFPLSGFKWASLLLIQMSSSPDGRSRLRFPWPSDSAAMPSEAGGDDMTAMDVNDRLKLHENQRFEIAMTV